MASRRLICVACPVGCSLVAHVASDGVIEGVEGNKCKRGQAYAMQELSCPMRMVTAVVPIAGALEPLSVKTAKPVPKERITTVLTQIKGLKLQAPVNAGDVLIPDVCSTGVAVVATKSIRHI